MKKDNKNLILYIIGILMLFVGLAVTTASTIIIISHNIKSKEYKETIAKVVAYDKKDNGLRAIIIEYSVNEKFYQITSNHYSNDPEKLDSEIKIKYNPKNHGEMIWIDNNRNGKYLASGIILLVGDIAIWFIINLKDKKKKDSKSLDDTKSLTPIPEDVKPEEIKEEPVEEKKEESTTPADGTIIIPIVEEETSSVEETTTEEKEEVVEEPKEETEPVKEEKEEVEEVEEEPVIVKEATAELPIIKSVTGEELPLFEKDAIPAIFTKETDDSVETEEEAIDEFKKKKEEDKLPVPELPELEEEMPKLNIPEIPYDLDSPRETVISNVLETTVALPVLKKEQIELPSKKENKSLKVNKNIKEDALSKLLDDIEKGN